MALWDSALLHQRSSVRRGGILSCGVRWGRLAMVGALSLTAGCATVGPESVAGTAGGIAWEVRDIVQSVAVDSRAIRWDYKIVLRETGGTAVAFTTIEYQMQASAGSGLMAPATTSEFRRRLDAKGQLERADNYTVFFTSSAVSSGFQTPATRNNYTRYMRFIGKTDAGAPVSVMVALPLSGTVGRKVTVPPGGALPPGVELGANDLSRLTGTWRGYYRNNYAINIPLTVSATERGDLECQEGDPINNQYRGAFAISAGAVSATLGREKGTLHFHEGNGRRVLVGEVIVRTVAYPVRLESDTVAVTPAAKSTSPSLPSDLKVVPPSPSVPTQLAAYSGTWSGRMDDKRDLTIVLEEVEESGVVMVISTEKVGWMRVQGSFVREALEFNSTSGTSPAINLRSRLQEDGSLAVSLSVAGVIARGRLARQP